MIDIDWAALGWVTLTTLIATVVIVTFYSLGLRLLAVTSPGEATRPLAATVGAVACIAVGIAAVLYGVYLVIPLFHQ